MRILSECMDRRTDRQIDIKPDGQTITTKETPLHMKTNEPCPEYKDY